MALGERVALPTKSLDDEPAVGVGGVGDQQCSHGHYGTRRDARPGRFPSAAIDRAQPRRVAASSCTRRSLLRRRSANDAEATIVLKAENLQRTGQLQDPRRDEQAVGVRDCPAPAESPPAAPATTPRRSPLQPDTSVCRARSSCRRARRSPRSRHAVSTEQSLIEGGDSLDEAVAAARARAAESGMVFCHPYDDLDVVAGQATLGRELIDDVHDLRRVIVPLGGGGLVVRHCDRGQGQRPGSGGHRRAGRGMRAVRQPARSRPDQSSPSPTELP